MPVSSISLASFTILLLALPVSTGVFINEINISDNVARGSNTLEIAGRAGSDLRGYIVVIYNVIKGRVMKKISLTGVIPDQSNNWGVLSFSVQAILLSDDVAVALVDRNERVIDFLSYRLSFTPSRGAAAGLTTTDIAKVSGDLRLKRSAQRVGFGNQSSHFSWALSNYPSFGNINSGQGFFDTPPALENGRPLPSPFINEFHYSNIGNDVGEMVEVAAPLVTNLNGYKLQLYNGENGNLYRQVTLDGTVYSSDRGWGFAAVSFDSGTSTGDSDSAVDTYSEDAEEILDILDPGVRTLKNGSTRSVIARQQGDAENSGMVNTVGGIALVDSNGSVIEFVSYGTSFVGMTGAAKGMTSTAIRVSESPFSPMDVSIQRVGFGDSSEAFSWKLGYKESFGSKNYGQGFSSELASLTGDETQSTFLSGRLPLIINEIQSKLNSSGLCVELASEAGMPLSGYHVVLYDGETGELVDSVPLKGFMPWVNDGLGFQTVQLGQGFSGSDFGVALVSNSGEIVTAKDEFGSSIEFYSVGKRFHGVNGPGTGKNSTWMTFDMKTADVTLSVQRLGMGYGSGSVSWSIPLTPSFGHENANQNLDIVFSSL